MKLNTYKFNKKFPNYIPKGNKNGGNFNGEKIKIINQS